MDDLAIIAGALLLLVIMAVLVIERRKTTNTPSENPLGEAEVYFAYGRKKEAKVILEKYLLSNSGNPKALGLLKTANEE